MQLQFKKKKTKTVKKCDRVAVGRQRWGQTAPRRRSLPAEPGSIAPDRPLRLPEPERSRRPRSCAQVWGGEARQAAQQNRGGSVPTAFAPGENSRVGKYQPKPSLRGSGEERGGRKLEFKKIKKCGGARCGQGTELSFAKQNKTNSPFYLGAFLPPPSRSAGASPRCSAARRSPPRAARVPPQRGQGQSRSLARPAADRCLALIRPGDQRSWGWWPVIRERVPPGLSR